MAKRRKNVGYPTTGVGSAAIRAYRSVFGTSGGLKMGDRVELAKAVTMGRGIRNQRLKAGQDPNTGRKTTEKRFLQKGRELRGEGGSRPVSGKPDFVKGDGPSRASQRAAAIKAGAKSYHGPSRARGTSTSKMGTSTTARHAPTKAGGSTGAAAKPSSGLSKAERVAGRTQYGSWVAQGAHGPSPAQRTRRKIRRERAADDARISVAKKPQRAYSPGLATTPKRYTAKETASWSAHDISAPVKAKPTGGLFGSLNKALASRFSSMPMPKPRTTSSASSPAWSPHDIGGYSPPKRKK